MTLAFALAAHFADDGPLPEKARVAHVVAADAAGPDDAVLLTRVAAGDSLAFELLFRRYRAVLCDFVVRYTGNVAAAEDLVHDVFLWVWRNAERINVRGSVRGYLFAAVRHRALDATKRESVADRARTASAAELWPAGEIAADSAMEGAEVRGAVRAAISGLTERRRAVITLRWAYQLSFAEIAQTLGVSLRTAETTHLRAMDDLRARLAGVVE